MPKDSRVCSIIAAFPLISPLSALPGWVSLNKLRGGYFQTFSSPGTLLTSLGARGSFDLLALDGLEWEVAWEGLPPDTFSCFPERRVVFCKPFSPKIYCLTRFAKVARNAKTWSTEVLKRMIRPTVDVPKSTINAPAGVTNVATPPQAAFPSVPARLIVKTEIKKSRAPTITFGWLKGVLSFERRRPKVKKINGRKIVVQEK